jgi:hypothetical protein
MKKLKEVAKDRDREVEKHFINEPIYGLKKKIVYSFFKSRLGCYGGSNNTILNTN